jgi:hypothetical protein
MGNSPHHHTLSILTVYQDIDRSFCIESCRHDMAAVGRGRGGNHDRQRPDRCQVPVVGAIVATILTSASDPGTARRRPTGATNEAAPVIGTGGGTIARGK